MNDGAEEYQKRHYLQVQESCYRLGIPVDIYYNIIIKNNLTDGKHSDAISILEKMIDKDELEHDINNPSCD